MSLPTDSKARKDIPIYTGFIKYFPLAIAAVAELSRTANEQHNPGQPVHWDRSKSGDELDAQMRHVLDYSSGQETDTDGALHLTKNAWRAMAKLQKVLEGTPVAVAVRAPGGFYVRDRRDGSFWLAPGEGKTVHKSDAWVYTLDEIPKMSWLEAVPVSV